MHFKLSTFAVLFCLTVPGVALASAEKPATQPSSTEAMQKRLLALQARLDQLAAKRQASQAHQDALLGQIRADADNRSQLMSVGGTASGYDPEIGFVLQSDDGNFSIHPGLLLQARYDVNYRNQIL